MTWTSKKSLFHADALAYDSSIHPVVKIALLRRLSALAVLLCIAALVGCNDDAEVVRQAKLKKKQQMQESISKVDHLGEAFGYIRRMIELDPQAATRQITYHLNAWIDRSGGKVSAELIPLGQRYAKDFPAQMAAVRPESNDFLPGDIDYFRQCFLLNQIVAWVDARPMHDVILADWLEDAGKAMPAADRETLQKTCRLFEWTLRNVRLEPFQRPAALKGPEPKDLPEGLRFDGPGYRQTMDECLWRGSGDGIQRSRVFIALCRQAGIDACVLAVKNKQANGSPLPWLVGVGAGESIYLFDLTIGTHVPGPNQTGVTTLAEAAEDELVLRRMKVAGLFEYPIDKSKLNDLTALLDVPLESFCGRMQAMQSGLTGDDRMRLSQPAGLAERFTRNEFIGEAVPWDIGLKADRYRVAMQRAMSGNLQILMSQKMQWGMMDPDFPLAKARWKHLSGQFDRDDDKQSGALILYRDLRVPDTDIENLPYDVELQRGMGVRRQPGQEQKSYDMQLQIAQAQYRQAKQAATFWLALIQFEESRYSNAATWQETRVLNRETTSPWSAIARYNAGRALEHLERNEEAIELYKTNGDPQEHGNRIRARLLAE